MAKANFAGHKHIREALVASGITENVVAIRVWTILCHTLGVTMRGDCLVNGKTHDFEIDFPVKAGVISFESRS